MNPGELNKRLVFNDFSLNAKKFVRSKRRDNEQNEETYDFIIRKNGMVKDYLTFKSENISYIILTVDEYQKEKGYLLLKCEKAKIHSFYDTCTVSRLADYETTSGSTRQELRPVYTTIPCEFIRLFSGSNTESEQENEINIRHEVHLENTYSIKNGDTIEVIHKGETYENLLVQDYFKSHTHQIVNVKLEGEA